MKRYAPFLLLAAVSGVWANYSIRPRIAEVAAASERIVRLQPEVDRWAWVEGASAHRGTIDVRPALSARGVTEKVKACNVSLTRLSGAAGGIGQIEVKSTFPCLVQFLESVSDRSCRLVSIRKNADGTLSASLTLEAI